MKLKGFFVLGAALGILTLAAAAPPAMAAVSVGFSIHAGDPFHGFSLHLSSAPNVVLVPGTRVGYVQNYDGDLYSYGNQWYLDQDDQWYCASSYDGPFYEINVASLPFDVSRFPVGYRQGGAFYGQQQTFYGQQQTFPRDNDRVFYDRGRSYQQNDRGWNQRETRDWNSGNARDMNRRGNRGWNQWNTRGWNRGQNGRGGQYSGNNRFNGGDRDHDGDRS